MSKYILTTIVLTACLSLLQPSPTRAEEALVLENDRLALRFDRKTGTLTALENKLTEETYKISGDEFAVEAVEFRLDRANAGLTSLELQGETVKAQYQGGGMTIDVTYTLGREHHFAEKQIILTREQPYKLKNVVLSRVTLPGANVRIVSYRYPQSVRRRKPGEGACLTFFGRTPKGGFFCGVELPFDTSSVDGREVVLQYAPSLKVSAGEKLACEPVYFGVYQRSAGEQEKENLPLQSESDAMVAMTSTILGPPRFGLVPMACGCHSEMSGWFPWPVAANRWPGAHTQQSVEGDMKSLDFLAECGIDWVSDSHPWGGETDRMNALGADDKYEPGALVRKFLEHGRKVKVKVVMWSSMNHTHGWSGKGRAFRADKPQWLLDAGTPGPPAGCPDWRKTVNGNCLGNMPFLEWLLRINLEGMATRCYDGWVMDGDFFGYAGMVIPADCQSDLHDHLPGDSNYACQRALNQLTASVREHYPDTYVFMCRPPQDLGVWSLRNTDACFTLLESGTGQDNLAAGDQIRHWSRVRVHHDFFPHYLDQPLLFPTRCGTVGKPSNWPSGHIDYIMLSALSCSPNQLYYMPTKTGIPDADKAEIRKWIDWGRKNIETLKVRKDLPDWPAVDKVDGSAHICDDQGLIFLFNPNKDLLKGKFALTEQAIGLKGKGTFKVSQDYPESDASIAAGYGDTVRWEVPGETAVVLRVRPAK
jgi:hypothetical protein